VKKLVVAPGAKVKSQQNKEGGSALRKACPQVAWYIYFEQKKKFSTEMENYGFHLRVQGICCLISCTK
jgi:hypothetical protein